MHILVFPNCGLRFPNSSPFKSFSHKDPVVSTLRPPPSGQCVGGDWLPAWFGGECSYTGSSLLKLTEIANGAMHFAYRRDLFQSSLSCIRSEGKSKGRSTQKKTAANKSANEDEETKVNQSISSDFFDSSNKDIVALLSKGKSRGRSPRKNSSSDRSWNEDEEKKSNRSIDGESVGSSTRKDIIALFRRIQSSISKGKSSSSNKRNSKNTKHRQSAESVLDVLHDQFPSKKQVTDKGPNQEGYKPLPQRTVVPKKETKTKGDSTRKGFKLLRPPSNFVQRSPIPSPSTPKEKIDEVLEEGSPSAVVVKDIELQRVDKLKLVELKELAKSRGVKGYSKLKKAELVELLKGLLQR